MTMIATPREEQIRNLLALPGEDFRALIENNLGEEDQPALWVLLVDPYVVRATYTALTTVYNDVCDQMAIRAAGMDAFKSECHDRGPAGKREYFEALGDYNAWRHRVLGYKRLVSRRIAEVKGLLPKAQNPPAREKQAPAPPMDAARKVRLMSTIFKLGQAIDRHRQASHDADINAEPHDLDLWEALEQIEVQTADARISVAQMLADIASKPGFTPTEENR